MQEQEKFVSLAINPNLKGITGRFLSNMDKIFSRVVALVLVLFTYGLCLMSLASQVAQSLKIYLVIPSKGLEKCNRCFCCISKDAFFTSL